MALAVAMAAIFAGVWSAPDVVRARLPILAGMGLNTSIALLLAGLALFLPRYRRWLGGLIAAISAAVIGQYFFAWMPPDGVWRIALNVDGHGLPWPGRMSPLAAFSLLCAGLALATLDRPRKLPGQILLQAAPGLILAAVVGGALNRSLDGLLFVATLDRHAVMSLPTMAALCVWISGYLAAMAETPWFRRFYAAREERQALAIGLIGFTAALLLGSAASVAVLGRQMQATVEEELSSSVRTQATIFPLVLSSALHSLHARTGGLASRADLPAALREMAGSNGSAWLAGSDGAARLRAGLSPADRRFRLRLDNTRSAWLTWNRGLMLEIHLPAAQGQGTIVVQEPLPELERLFTEALSDTQGGVETRLCGRAGSEHMVCLPSAFMPRPLLAPMRYKDEPVPMWHALQGQRGVAVAPDYRGVMVVAAYVPVAELGLGMVRKVDVEKMYQPIRTAVWRAIAIMAGIGMIAALLIHLRVRFVVRRAVDTGRQLRGVLEALPVGVWLTDASGHFILNNPAGNRIWAGEREIATERPGEFKGWRHDTGKRIEAHDWALARAIERGETSLDEVIDIECFDGSRKVISNSALPLHDEKGAVAGAVMVCKDITEQMRADAEIRRLEREFHSLAENLPDIVSRFDSELRRVYVNPEIEKATGMSRQTLLGKTYAELGVPDKEVEIWTNALRRVFFTGEPEVFEFKFTTQCGVVKYYHTRAVPECDASGKVVSVLTIARDISTLKGAEAVLRESEERLHGITSNVPGMVFQCYRHGGDEELQFTYISNGAKWLLGLDAAAILRNGRAFTGFIVPDDERSFQDSMAQSQEELSFWNWEGRIVTADGETSWINLRATPRRHGENVCMWDGVAINITESKTSEEKLVDSKNMLRELSAHLESVREEERKRIAREIHDELGQTLTALRMDVSLARLGFGEANPQLMARLQSMKQLVDRTIETARHVTSSLRPGALDLGIVAALEWLVEEFIEYAGIPCELVLGDGDIALDEFTATAVFRIVQESLTNIARHAEATQVEIVVTRTDGQLCFEVSDNGKGFDPHAAASRKSFGLVGIRERVAMMEGDFELDSEPERGTRIRVCVPAA
ncbi:MAG TPA: PAS domain S-box protein [Thiobacillus sp.]|nr:PAS domain S-box protein [Thiobacillus sp.]